MQRFWWILAGFVIGATVVCMVACQAPEVPRTPTRLTVTVPTGHELLDAVIAPDGSALVYVAQADDRRQLFHRRLDRFEAIPLPGTEGASNPFFSPDGAWVGFFADDRLKKVPLAGGPPQVVVDAPLESAAASWTADGMIVMAPTRGLGLVRVPEDGGPSETLTSPNTENGETEHGWPHVLPGEIGILFTIARKERDTRVAVWSQEDDEWRLLLPANGPARYVSTGHIIYTLDEELLAVPFDLDTLEIRGAPETIIQGVAASTAAFAGLGRAHFSLSNTGTLVHVPAPGSADNLLVWVDRDGRASPFTSPQTPGRHYTPRLSPDETRLAIVRQSGVLGRDIWLYDLTTASETQLMLDGSDNRSPAWSADGELIAFASNRLGPQNMFSTSLTGRSADRLVASRDAHNPSSWSESPGGRLLAYYEVNVETGRDVWVLAADGSATAVAATRFNERSPVFSPDGRWLAFVSDEDDFDHVYVQPYPPTGERWVVTLDGGREPLWSADGAALFFRRGAQMLVVDVRVTPTFAVGEPSLLFEREFERDPGGNLPNYDVTSDGQRFLMLQRADRPHEIRLTLDWLSVLR